MPLDGTEFALSGDHPLAKLAAVERLIATRQQWCQGRMRDEKGRYCLVGAIEAADARLVLEPIILRAAREIGGKRYWRIEFFNDDPRTTHADVLRVLRRARENIIHSMIGGERRLSWRQMLTEAWRAVRAGSVAKACAVLRVQPNEPHHPVAAMPVSVSIDQETRETERVLASRTLCDVS
jgi:hypothetical protein